MSSSETCIFCQIVAGRAPAARVLETNDSLAFLDLNPVATGHTLVIPKVHARNLFDLSETASPGLVNAVAAVARALRQSFQADGLTVIQTNERAGGQVVFHLHFHLIPRFETDGIMSVGGGIRQWTWRVERHFEPAELEPLAKRIRQALD